MNVVFADSSYWIALLSRHDQLHATAISISSELGNSRIVTSEMVLTEVLNAFSSRGGYLRQKAFEIVEKIMSNPNVVVSPQTNQLFIKALKRYKDRPDKQWSLTDCASMIIMDEYKINRALTHDEHFEQAGYEAMLR